MEKLDTRRIGIYLLFAFGYSWLLHLVIYLNGGLRESPELVAGTGITLAFALIAGSMFGPAIGHVAARLITREGWQDVWLRPHFRHGWRYWLLVWAAIPLLVLVGAALFFTLFPAYFDPQSEAFRAQLAAAGVSEGVELILFAQLAAGILIAPILNAVPILGEEFGWRAYLQPRLLPLGERPAMIWMGIIWGIWHWPIIAMGYNYGFDYPGYPWVGMGLFLWFTFATGTLFGWATLRARSVWPAVIGHGLLNGLAAGPALFLQGEPSTLLGPLAIGVIGGFGFSLVALYLFFFRLGGEPDPAPAAIEESADRLLTSEQLD